MSQVIKLYDFRSQVDDLYETVLINLQKPQKELPSKLFYDEKGSQLFDQISTLPEYYPTRVEQRIMDECIHEIADIIGLQCLLIEYGSGSSKKTRTLLNHLPQMAGYIPIDISKEHLMQSAQQTAVAYPTLEILPVCADYEDRFQLPTPIKPVAKKVIYYPGSTIGNFHPAQAISFLKHMRNVCGQDCALLIGVDLKKDSGILHRAYNDCAGVTAAFNLNILTRLNRELGTNFQEEQFEHYAFYNEEAGRIEMHLSSRTTQTIRLNGTTITIAKGECLWTESSYKYSLHEFETIAQQAGFQRHHVWTDANCLFSVQYFTP